MSDKTTHKRCRKLRIRPLEPLHKFKGIFDDADYYLLEFSEKCLKGTIKLLFEKDVSRPLPYSIKLFCDEENSITLLQINNGCSCHSALLAGSRLKEALNTRCDYMREFMKAEEWESRLCDVLKQPRNHRISWLHMIRRRCKRCREIREIHCTCPLYKNYSNS